jgi:hypothetical protein
MSGTLKRPVLPRTNVPLGLGGRTEWASAKTLCEDGFRPSEEDD